MGSFHHLEAETERSFPYIEDIGCVKIDHHQKSSKRVREVIYSAGKTVEQMRAIYRSFL